MYWLLVLLILSGQVWAQPVEGPWAITTSTNAIISPEVCVRGSNADLLFIENDSVRYARFSLTTDELISGPSAVFALQGWGVQQLHDLIAVNDSMWACIVSEDEGPGWPGHNDIHHRVDLVYGGDAASSSRGLDSSTTSWYFPVDGEYWDEGFSLTPRVGGGVVAGWIVSTFRYFDISVTFRVGAYNATYHEDFSRIGGSGIWNPEGNRALARCVTNDSIMVVTSGSPLCSVIAADEYPYCYWQTDCDFSSALDLGRTHAGNIRLLACPQEFDCVPQILSVEPTGEVSSHCELLDSVDVPTGSHASFWQPDYGFGVLAISSSSLQLARVDTNGIQTQPTGTVFWRDDNHTFTEANLTIADDGLIVALWTETQDGDTTARSMMLGTVGWNTPLSVDRRPEAAASIREFALSAYPNPFNGETTITYDVPQTGKVELSVYNLLGEEVEVLVRGTVEAGRHTAVWRPQVSSGIYFARLTTPPLSPPLKQGGGSVMRKIVYLR